MRALSLLIVVCALGAFLAFRDRPVAQPPGILVADVPRQEALRDGDRPFRHNDEFTLTPLARFALEARVLGREDYHLDTEAALAPVDLALGWQRMSDSAVLDRIDIDQRNRFYYWRVEAFPIPRREIETQSANMHLIPGSPTVARRLDAVRQGEVVRLRGFLVEVTRDDGWRWRSSLTREDTGAGACELIFVEWLEVLPTPSGAV